MILINKFYPDIIFFKLFKMSFLLFFIFIFSSCGPAIKKHVTTPFDIHKNNDFTFIKDKDNLPQLDHPGNFFELWWFDAQTDDGIVIIANFHLGFLVNGLGDNPFVELMIYMPGESPVYEKQVFTWDDFKTNPSILDLSIGPNQLSGNYPVYSIKCKTERISMDLKFEALFKSGRMEPDTINFSDGTYLGWLVTMPRARVSGTINVGEKNLAINGYGYHDHAWGNISIVKTLKGWNWFRFHDKDTTIMFADYYLTDSCDRNNIPLLMIFHKNKPIVITDKVVISSLGTYPVVQMHHVPKASFKVEILDKNVQGHIILTPDKIVHYHDFLDERSWFIKTMAHIFYGYPEGIRFRSGIEMNIKTASGNIKTNGENAFQEILYLK